MFSLHVSRRRSPITQSFEGVDPKALGVLVLAVVSFGLIVAGFVMVAG